MRTAALACLLLAAAGAARGDDCRSVEVRFAPAVRDLQIAVWIEDAQGRYVDTVYVTRLTGTFGLANRPGTPLLKTDLRWPYGRREMVLPVWAHRRGAAGFTYPKVVMGGVCGNSPASQCPDGTPCGGECEDSTIAYHEKVSSLERFYCAPGRATQVMDVITCASEKGATLSKGAYASNERSFYPPRADLTEFALADSNDTRNFSVVNDLVALSHATPPPGSPVVPPATWYPKGAPDGDYVAWVELSQESDFNKWHNHPNQPDTVQVWDWVGHPFLGQPSVVYKVPFHLGGGATTAAAAAFAGYGAWDGQDGMLRPDDGTISDAPGTGAGRLLDVDDGSGAKWRVKVVAQSCSLCGMTPAAPTDLALSSPGSSTIQVQFRAPASATPDRYAVRYREGAFPATEDNFDQMFAADDGQMAAPGGTVTSRIEGLRSGSLYTVAVRGLACGRASPVVSAQVTTGQQQFVVLHGCFVATAAYGSPLAAKVERLRRFRDDALLTNAVGRLATAAYYGLSPSAAAAIAGDRRLRNFVRFALEPLVALVGN